MDENDEETIMMADINDPRFSEFVVELAIPMFNDIGFDITLPSLSEIMRSNPEVDVPDTIPFDFPVKTVDDQIMAIGILHGDCNSEEFGRQLMSYFPTLIARSDNELRHRNFKECIRICKLIDFSYEKGYTQSRIEWDLLFKHIMMIYITALRRRKRLKKKRLHRRLNANGGVNGKHV